jgi:diketogulonate reductase-like aldo/keto reductase
MENKFSLNNGIEIPSIGFGTWQTPNNEIAINSIKLAVKTGYRHIDTAAVYGNEKSVGIGIKSSGIDREDIFVTSKVWNSNRGYESTLKAFEQSISDLQLDYLDLYLIHWPATKKQFDNWQVLNSDTWRALEKLHADNRIKSIGVSNFLPHHLEPLMEVANIVPAVNQIEFHPGYQQQECVTFCKKNDILVEAWAPLGRAKYLNNETLVRIAEKYQATTAQLCIKWILQNGLLPLPKSITPSRIIENFKVDHFDIAEEDMWAIQKLENLGGSGLHPDEVDF